MYNNFNQQNFPQQQLPFIPSLRNGNNANGNSNESSNEDLATITAKKKKVEDTISVRLVSTKDLTADINEFFKASIKNYIGCTLLRNQIDGSFNLTLYVACPAGSTNGNGVEIIESTAGKTSSTNDGVKRILNMNNKNKSTQFRLNKIGKEVLSKYLHGERNIKGPWSVTQVEDFDPRYGSRRLCLQISNLSLEKVYRDVYETVSSDKEEKAKISNHDIVQIAPTSIRLPGGTINSMNWLLEVKVINKDVIDKIAKANGMIPFNGNGSIPMYRA